MKIELKVIVEKHGGREWVNGAWVRNPQLTVFRGKLMAIEAHEENTAKHKRGGILFATEDETIVFFTFQFIKDMLAVGGMVRL